MAFNLIIVSDCLNVVIYFNNEITYLVYMH